ncbi:MAG TPA: response regulator [Ktedonosporobacter sp.]|nr:response regulator [Ktedonosporobacter sp.]
MEDIDTANTTPGSGSLSLSHEAIPYEVIIAPRYQQHKGQQAIQRILLVEDDQALATLEAAILTGHGYTVVTVPSGELAIKNLHDAIPDLVVLDIELTGDVHGWEVLQALRAFTTIPVLLTTSSTAAVRKYRRQHGETKLTLDHLPKPYPMQTLLKRVKRMLIKAP